MSNNLDCKLEVERINQGDNAICLKLYNEMMAFLITLNKSRKVNSHILNDIAQNAMIVFLLNLKNNRFKYESTLATYLSAIAKNEYYKYFADNKDVLIFDDAFLIEDLVDRLIDDVYDVDELTEIKLKVFKIEFNKLKKQCRRLIRFSISIADRKIIGEKMGLENEAVARERIYRCKLMLVSLIKKNKLYIKTHEL